MTKVAALFFNKMFQTKKEVTTREKSIVVAGVLFTSILITGYFMAG